MDRLLCDEIIAAKMTYTDSDTWNAVVSVGIEDLIGKYEDAIDLNAIGFRLDWKSALTKEKPRIVEIITAKEVVTTAD